MMLKPVFSHFTMKKGILPFLQEFPCSANSSPAGPGSGGRCPGPRRSRLADCWRSSKVNRLLGAKDNIDDFTESLESLAIILLQFQFSLVQFHSVQFVHFSLVQFVHFSLVQFSTASVCRLTWCHALAGGWGAGPLATTASVWLTGKTWPLLGTFTSLTKAAILKSDYSPYSRSKLLL